MALAAASHSCGFPTVLLEIDTDSFERCGRRRMAVSANQVLERVGCVVMATVRRTDFVCCHRHGSFCLLLSASMVSDAKTMAERICSNIESTPLLAGTNVSVSVAVTVSGSEPVTEIADPADVALAFVSRSGGSIVVHD
jgi:GGDEF domain-containing protein